MLYPSIDTLMKRSTLNIPLYALHNARKIQDGDTPYLEHYKCVKPVGKALEEIAQDKLTFSRADKECLRGCSDSLHFLFIKKHFETT